ncbi:hypothetical protein D0C36_00640 [Mucilaginibacter conchicola]|uniref:Pentapeptide repeat-containing protein n=1 Tax=Mucilaginibacter conchicola TaxID=2303333 RepID=A0A372NWN3_9SPHI|nr:hypothetical protein [Mucilaginibacter conchicola]RFZ94099.1 hypothetical protein D0C36_00640 [Mucilaginibacter conchicola]
MDCIEISNSTKQLLITKAVIEKGEINTACINGLRMRDVAAINIVIEDANLSDLEIKYAQLGGAYIHDIGLPPAGHPYYDPNAEQRPLRFENCDLHGSTITNCDLSMINIIDCNTTGLTINGISVDDLLKAYKG